MAQEKFTKLPTPTGETKERYETWLEVMAKTLTEVDAAKRLGMSRWNFQNLMGRALQAAADSMEPKRPGPVPKSPREAELEKENAQLRASNARMEENVAMLSRIFQVGSRISQGKSPVPRKKKGGANDPEEPDPAHDQLLREVDRMTTSMAAFVLAVSESTVRRQRQRKKRGVAPPRQGRPPKPSVPMDGLIEMVARIEDTRGTISIAGLHHLFPYVSRRDTAYIKHVTMLAFRRRRREHLQGIDFTQPGVVRGFDAMFVPTAQGLRYLLVASDAAVGFRTTLELVETYDEDTVAAALERDFATHGAPLVLRLDRASCHRTEKIRALCERHGVLMLHGPPHHPRFYGQLERQNRDHRAWLDAVGRLSVDEVRREIFAMEDALNRLVPRRKLAWSTAAEAWEQRPNLDVDRLAFAHDVAARAAALRNTPAPKGATEDRPERLAIEEALTQRGFLSRRTEGWC